METSHTNVHLTVHTDDWMNWYSSYSFLDDHHVSIIWPTHKHAFDLVSSDLIQITKITFTNTVNTTNLISSPLFYTVKEVLRVSVRRQCGWGRNGDCSDWEEEAAVTAAARYKYTSFYLIMWRYWLDLIELKCVVWCDVMWCDDAWHQVIRWMAVLRRVG